MVLALSQSLRRHPWASLSLLVLGALGALRRLWRSRVGRLLRRGLAGCTVVEIGAATLFVVVSGGFGRIPPESATELIEVRLERAAADLFEGDRSAKRCSIDGLMKRGLYDGRSRDAWGRSFRFECRRDRVRVVSAGPDGVFGTCDDIRPRERSTCGLSE